MKKNILSFLIAFIAFGLSSAFAQIPVDTVCAGTTGKSYWVSKTNGSTYNWTINGGTKASGGNSDSITINWSSTPGTDTLTIVETNANGCVGDPVKLLVVRMPIPTSVIAGTTTLCANDSAQITVNLTGTFPINFTWTDGSGNTNVTNVPSSPYTFNTGLLTGTKTYSVTAISDRLGCVGTNSGSAVVTVNPRPVTSVIFH